MHVAVDPYAVSSFPTQRACGVTISRLLQLASPWSTTRLFMMLTSTVKWYYSSRHVNSRCGIEYLQCLPFYILCSMIRSEVFALSCDTSSARHSCYYLIWMFRRLRIPVNKSRGVSMWQRKHYLNLDAIVIGRWLKRTLDPTLRWCKSSKSDIGDKRTTGSLCCN